MSYEQAISEYTKALKKTTALKSEKENLKTIDPELEFIDSELEFNLKLARKHELETKKHLEHAQMQQLRQLVGSQHETRNVTLKGKKSNQKMTKLMDI